MQRFALLILCLVISEPAAARHAKKFSQQQQPQLTYLYDVQGENVVAHPAGCPRYAFCGCGVSVKVFGRPVRELFLASNWLRKFNHAAPGPGMVAARGGHVMYIMALDANGNAVVYDPNSGGRKTRIHTRSLAGYRVVNPQSPRGTSPVYAQHGARHVTGRITYQERDWAL